MSLFSRVRSSTFGLLPLVLLAIAPQARAVSASAAVDWSAMQVSVRDTAADDGIVAGISWLNNGITSAYLCPDNLCDLLGMSFDPTSSASYPVFGPGFSGQADWSAAGIQGSITGRAGNTDTLVAVSRWDTFRFDGAGEVTISVPFTLSTDATGSDAMSGSFAIAGLWSDGLFDQWYISSPWDGTHTTSGLLSLTLAGADGTSRIFSATTYATLDAQPVLPPPVAAPVPEPASLALLLGGVGLVAGVTRRRARRVD